MVDKNKLPEWRRIYLELFNIELEHDGEEEKDGPVDGVED